MPSNRHLVIVLCFSSRRRHTRYWRDWSSDVCSSDLLDQFQNSPAAGFSSRETGHDRLPQVEAKGLGLNEFFQGLAGISSSQSVAHAAHLDSYFSKNLQN